MTNELPRSGCEAVLSSMARVYELSGIEPELILHHWNGGLQTDDWKLLQNKNRFSVDYKYSFNYYSYYPESQLWDICPKRIKNSVLRLEMKELFYVDLEYGLRLHRVDALNLHTALVEMTLWCLENDIIKTCKKNGKTSKGTKDSI